MISGFRLSAATVLYTIVVSIVRDCKNYWLVYLDPFSSLHCIFSTWGWHIPIGDGVIWHTMKIIPIAALHNSGFLITFGKENHSARMLTFISAWKFWNLWNITARLHTVDEVTVLWRGNTILVECSRQIMYVFPIYRILTQTWDCFAKVLTQLRKLMPVSSLLSESSVEITVMSLKMVMKRSDILSGWFVERSQSSLAKYLTSWKWKIWDFTKARLLLDPLRPRQLRVKIMRGWLTRIILREN